MKPIAVNEMVIDTRLLCTTNFTESAATSTSRHFFKCVGPLRWKADEDMYEVLTQREAERYLEEGVQLLHLHVHATAPVTALLSVYNGFSSLGDEKRRHFVVSCRDKSALGALCHVIN
ncbi:hypothetical protein SARC_12351 [Sphaeroforma arctica JP610]|uniref:Uncharacterized protein n=1 Tax=Sphaeroforma arctica JP610 TaxID=667725 RepID=A0A0L0FEF3_9EUKA|nr:hypothetical protein SARC_12351 [Sphaeroforma arctica JP610]KNC75115.1 hypothetical protein SARC_12351 [Sphaeroforma arctica JP610]|eukprot:XP_014149017.1 hypothetical protein SARC_12351 [Sphaeroforma arctica JP610]